MLPIQSKPISRSAQSETPKVDQQVGALSIECDLCCAACILAPITCPLCSLIPGCSC